MRADARSPATHGHSESACVFAGLLASALMAGVLYLFDRF